MTFGEGLAEAFDNVFDFDHWGYFEESAEDDHIENADVVDAQCFVHRFDFVDVDVFSRGCFVDTIIIVDDAAALFDSWLELLE